MRNAWLLCLKELRSYFNSPVAYIVLTLFLLITGFFFTTTLFLIGQATMRQTFQLTPIVMLFFVPAITMRLIAEEKRSGSIELLFTLPTRDWEIVVGKFAAAWIFISVAIGLTLAYTISVAGIGSLDAGETFGGYLGLILMGGAFAAIGTWTSSLTQNQIVSFVVSLTVIAMLYLVEDLLGLLPLSWAPVLQFLSVTHHFNNLARGVIDSRDLLYFVSLIFLMLSLAHTSLDSRRWK